MSAVGQMLLFGLGMIGLLIVLMIVFGVLAAVALPIGKAALAAKTLTPQTIVTFAFIVAGPFYILFFFAMRLITYCWLWIPIIRHPASTLSIENSAAVKQIARTMQPRQKLGVADSFELGAF
jgi:hypothetical protein